MASFRKNQTLEDFQKFIEEVYAIPDDRLYSMADMLVQQQRFTMKSLKGIRKQDRQKIKKNLMIALSWLMAIANRLHISAEKDVWKRFPMLCSYCGKKPCVCKKVKPEKRKHVKMGNAKKPKNLVGFQKMFDEIYPAENRTLADAGVHLAEEMGEVSEAIHNFLGQHKNAQFEKVKVEISDYISCSFGVANSAKINVAQELEKMFYNNCHICHKIRCTCNFSRVSKLKT
ncbi:MAG: hypothetical protein AAB513_00560 [Patescibacteria group bacterium]